MKKRAKTRTDTGAALLSRIAAALDRLAPAAKPQTLPENGDAFVWEPQLGALSAVAHVASIALPLLKAIENQRDTLIGNTQRFADGLPANNALLWGARGMGKSSLVKAVHHEVNRGRKSPLVLIELHREDIASLPLLLRLLRRGKRRYLLFCDDLSFDRDDTSYKSLKAVLEGGIEGRPDNVLFYATSNRRHLMPRDMMDNERATAINPGEAVEEKVSLSDRFGLWLGFHNCSQDDYLAMVEAYAGHYGLKIMLEDLRARALAWAMGRGSRSGRVAWQFIQDLAGELGSKI
ncbi:MAG TPA: ATP-binding protein [Rhizomicrobium sp.]|nr:ATP-binding protein [Rhizomicrobium sp.]